MKAEELNKLMEAYNSMYAPKEEVVESEQLEEGMGLSVGLSRLGGALLSNPRTSAEQGAKNLQKNLTDPVGFAVKGALKKVGKALVGDKPITAGGGTPDTEKSDERIRELARQRGTLKQDVDLFDIVKGYLLDEGHAETEEEALYIMANMSEEWRQSILSEDPVQDFRDMRRAAENRSGARGPEFSHGPNPTGMGTSNKKPAPTGSKEMGTPNKKPAPTGSKEMVKPRSREFTNPPS